MNHQTTLPMYFKRIFHKMEGNKKRRNLSLLKTPTKAPKITSKQKNVIVIDDEDELLDKFCGLNESQLSTSSESTIIYSKETPSETSPISSCSGTPSTGNITPIKSSPNFQSPSSQRKYFSPTKKRSVAVKTPTKARRNLCYNLSENECISDNEDFFQATQNMDDKTVFLLKTIHQLLSDNNLKSLLSSSSCNLLSSVMQVKKPGMRLVCRLFWQQGGWRRWEQVKKILKGNVQIDDAILHEAIDSLAETGFISLGNSSNGENIDFDDLTKLLKLDEIKSIGKYFKIKRTTKEDIVRALRNLCHQKSNIITNYFAGNKLSNESHVLNNYMNACSIYDELDVTTVVNKRCDIIDRVYNLYKSISDGDMINYLQLPAWLRRYTSPYVYVKILDAGIQDLKKDKIERNINLAIDILSTLINQNAFREHKKSEWYAEKALILDKLLGRAEEAAELLLEGLNLNLSDDTKDIMRPRAKLIANRKTNAISSPLKSLLLVKAEKYDILEKNIKATHIYKQPMNSNGKGKIKFMMRTGSEMKVCEAEEYCIHHYIEAGRYTHGGHWEGNIVTTIFFLLFWDIIYAKIRSIPGIFLSYYQLYPLDMFYEDFYKNRKSLIERRLREIEESPIHDILAKMKNVWDTRPECELSSVQRSIGWEAVSAVCRRLAPRRVASLARRLALDYRYAHSGFPDLTLWNANTDEVAFVEVKTDSDKPSMKQIKWMHYMNQHDIHTEFCYVGVNTFRARSRNMENLEG